MIVVEKISENAYDGLEVPVLFDNVSTDRSFGTLLLGEKRYKLAWASSMISPVILQIDTFLYCIGVDLVFLMFDSDKEKALLKLSLDYFFYDVRLYGNDIYVITELEILKIGVTDLNICKKYPLPDYFDGITIKEGAIEVKCVDGSILFF